MKCNTCGTQNDAGASVCEACGEPFAVVPDVGQETPDGAQAHDDSGSIPGAGIARKMMDSRRARKEEEARQEAELRAKRDAARQAAFVQAQQSCPLPIVPERISLPGGLKLFEDEFLVGIAKDWGFTTKSLILTTHRLIHAKGIITKDQEVVNLTDVMDVNYHKTLMVHGSIEIETSGGHSMTGLPRAKNVKELRNQLLSLVHWAKERPRMMQQVPMAAAAAPAAAPAAPHKYDQLQTLHELHTSGVLNDVEFEQEKAKILAQE